MAFKFLDRVRHAAVGAPGTGPFVLSNALAGFQTFVQAGAANGDTFSYIAEDGTNWEYGIGTFSSSGMNGTVVRTTITKTSNQNTSPISLSSKANISATLRGEDIGAISNLAGLTDVNINEATMTDGQSLAWDVATAKFLAAAPAGTALSGLSDVNITEGSGIDGYTLNWNNGSSKWEAVAPVTGSGATSGSGSATGVSTARAVTLPPLNRLPDVNVTYGSGIDGYSLTWDNATNKWVATNVTGGGSSTLHGLSDVNVTEGAPIDGKFLKWDNGTSKWIAATAGGGGSYVGGTPPTIVQAQAAQGSNVISVTFGSAPTNGNLLVAFFFDTGGNPTAGSGWTALDLLTSAALDASIFIKTAGAGESTTQTPSSSTGGSTALVVWEISGVATGIVDYQGVGSNGVSVPTGKVPSIPTIPSSLFLSAIATTITSVAITSLYGLASSAILSSTGVQMGYGHSDSSNAQSYGESAVFASAIAFGYTSVVVM